MSQSVSPEAAPQVPASQPDLVGTQMKRRNPVGAWLGLPIVTLGIYGIVWYYLVHSELANFDRRRSVNAGLALCSILLGTLTLGIWPLVTWVKLAGHIRNAQRAAGLEPSCSGGLGFLLGIIGFGVLYYQIELNKVVKHYGDAAPGSQVPLAA
ncbi:MAG: DUF4234 domain-containing protein [Actinoallomurus sp.]